MPLIFSDTNFFCSSFNGERNKTKQAEAANENGKTRKNKCKTANQFFVGKLFIECLVSKCVFKRVFCVILFIGAFNKL